MDSVFIERLWYSLKMSIFAPWLTVLNSPDPKGPGSLIIQYDKAEQVSQWRDFRHRLLCSECSYSGGGRSNF